MLLNGVYPPSIDEMRADLALCAEQFERKSLRRAALAILNLLDALQYVDGPELWLRLSHGSHFAVWLFDPDAVAVGELARPSQIEVRSSGVDYCVKFLLPVESRPWLHSTANVESAAEAVALIKLAAVACEQRREHLVFTRFDE